MLLGVGGMAWAAQASRPEQDHLSRSGGLGPEPRCPYSELGLLLRILLSLFHLIPDKESVTVSILWVRKLRPSEGTVEVRPI